MPKGKISSFFEKIWGSHPPTGTDCSICGPNFIGRCPHGRDTEDIEHWKKMVPNFSFGSTAVIRPLPNRLNFSPLEEKELTERLAKKMADSKIKNVADPKKEIERIEQFAREEGARLFDCLRDLERAEARVLELRKALKKIAFQDPLEWTRKGGVQPHNIAKKALLKDEEMGAQDGTDVR